MLFRSRFIPRLLSGWGVFASLLIAAYALSTIVFPKAGALQLVPMLPMGLYEVSLGVWLLLNGAKIEPSGTRSA